MSCDSGEQEREKGKEKESENTLEAPDFIINSIFTLLGRADIHKCGGVSRQWRKVASDPCFGWINVIAIPLHYQPMSATYFNFRAFLNQASKDISRQPMEFSSFDTLHQHNFYLTVRNNNEKLFTHYVILPTCLRGKPDYEDDEERAVVKYIRLAKENPRLWRCKLMKLGMSPIYNGASFCFLFEVNIREAEKLVENGEKVPLIEFINYMLKEESDISIDNLFKCFSATAAHIPQKKTTVTQKQPAGLSKKLKLYKYQLDAVSWLKSVEENVNTGFEYTELLPWREAKTKLLFSRNEPTVVTNYCHFTKKVFPKGGILADEMGLGKTTEIINNTNILANPGDPSLLALPERDESKEKQKGEITIANEQEKEKEAENGELGKEKSILNEKDLFVTNATLVICPPHLLKQWHEEIEKHTSPHLDVVSIATTRDRSACYYSDIVNCDVVLLNEELTLESEYEYFNFGNNRRTAELFIYDFNKSLSRVWNLENPLSQRSPVLEHFLWRRIVIDEAHEQILETNNSLWTAKYFWYVSGTPIPNSRTMSDIIKFLKFPDTRGDNLMEATFADIYMNNLYWRNTKESVKNEYIIPPIVEDVVLLEYTPIEKEIYPIFKHDMGISHFGLSTSSPFSESTTLSQMKTDVLHYLKTRATKNTEVITSNKDKIKTLIASVEEQKKEAKIKNQLQEDNTNDEVVGKRNSRAHKMYHLKHYMRMEVKQIRNRERKITERETDLAFCEKCIERISALPPTYSGRSMQSEASIPELLETSDNSELENKEVKEDLLQENVLPASVIVDMRVADLKAALEVRGITFKNNLPKSDLQRLLKEAVKNNVKPEEKNDTKSDQEEQGNEKRKLEGSDENEPNKKQKVDIGDKIRTTEDKINDQNLLIWLVEKEGTKFGNVLFYLKQLWTDTPAAKIIFFSEYAPVLKKLSNVLLEANVEHATLVGNMQKRVQQMRSFKTTREIRALLLDINSVSSGTNIIEATHIIFLEPKSGSKSEAKAIEDQAIARAYRQGQKIQVTVVRFVIRDTEEHSQYLYVSGTSPSNNSSD